MTSAQAGNRVWRWNGTPHAAGCWHLVPGCSPRRASVHRAEHCAVPPGAADRPLRQSGGAAWLGELDVRIGGIRALERVARDTPADHRAVMEMLAAFIREHSRPQWPPSDPGGQVRERSLRPDVQAAMTAVGRRLAERDTGPVDLTRADLTGADLAGADLPRGPRRRQAHRRGSQRRRSHRRQSRRHRPDGRGPHRHRPHPRGADRRLVATRVASSGGLDATHWLWPADTGRRWR